ncbi:hypothetical protein PIB30_054944 [Stylosanthes scabra]|uniref:Uncharacterized protein n=1 Tax=Stylosanthes scabra TaxID=79078 RepID=A0ABU6ZHQ3_9FABA|nr:hypothetical protein [Stylosanthes scabra]
MVIKDLGSNGVVTHPLGAGTFVRCSSESPLSLADDVLNVLKEVSQGATKIPSMTRFWVQLPFGAGVAWTSCLNPRLPRVTHCHRYNPAVTRTSCALAKYGASDLCPGLTNSRGSPLSPGQTSCHRLPSTCAMLSWRTSYGQGTATMLAGV